MTVRRKTFTVDIFCSNFLPKINRQNARMFSVLLLLILPIYVGLTGPSNTVNCNSIDDSSTISEIAEACATVECKPGHQLSLIGVDDGNNFFKNIQHLRCCLYLEGEHFEDKNYVFLSLETWQWTEETIISGFIKELSFPALKIIDGGVLKIEPSESLKKLTFNENLQANLAELRFCNLSNLNTDNLIKILKPKTVFECSVNVTEEIDNDNQEISKESSSKWYVKAIILAISVIPVVILVLLAFFYRKDIYPAYYYLLQRIRTFVEYLREKRGQNEPVVNCQPNAEEDSRPTPADEDLTTVPTSSLRRGDLLGQGNFGVVYQVEHPRYGVTVAKWYTLDETDRKSVARRGRRESRLGAELRGCPQIVQSLAAIHDDQPEQPIGILFELMPGGDLWTHVKENPETEVAYRNKWACDLAKALDFIHGKRYIHRDVKPTNVLLSASRTIAKLADMGLMTQASRGKKHEQGIGNLLYTAPEVFLSTNYGRSVDVYSYGLTIFYCFYGRDPYEEDQYPFGWFNFLTAVPLQDDINRPELDGKEIDAIIEKCWQGIPHKRIRIGEVLAILDAPEGQQMFPRVQEL